MPKDKEIHQNLRENLKISMAVTVQIYNSDGKFTDVTANGTHIYQRALKGKFLVFPPCVT
jgi:hypothetical protein